MIYAIDHKILFYHVPKTGGTSITWWMENNNLGLVANIKPMHAHPQFLANNNFSLPVNWSFCVVRNPWERWVSWWYFWKFVVKKFDHSFEEYTEKYFTGQYDELRSQGGHYGSNIPQVHYSRHVDEVLRHENLQEDFKKVQDKFNCSAPLDKRGNVTTGKLHYSHYYTSPRLIDLVSNYYKEDIEEFGYAYEV